jgi:hypothetical protein
MADVTSCHSENEESQNVETRCRKVLRKPHVKLNIKNKQLDVQFLPEF